MKIIQSSNYPDSFDAVIDMLKNRKRSLDYGHTVIVPDRHTLEAEKIIMEELNENGSFDIDVLTFSRLCFKLTGGGKDYLSRDGAVMVISGILERKKNELNFFGKNRDKRGTAKEILATLNQFLSSGVNPSELAADGNSLLSKKLGDIITIYEEYSRFLKDGNYSDSQSIVYQAALSAGTAEFCKNRTFYIVGFDAVPYSFLKLLSEMEKNAAGLIFSIVCYDKIIGGTELKESILNNPLFSDANPEITFPLETLSGFKKDILKNLFDFNLPCSPASDERITLHRSSNETSQAESVARTIAHYVYNGLNYSDIGILGSIPDSVEMIFSEYGIPLNIDLKRSLSIHPYIKHLLDYLDAVRNNCRIQTVLDIVFNFFSGIQKADAEAFDSYAAEFSIDYNRLLSTFTLGKFDDDGRARSEFFRAEKVRQSVAANIAFLKSRINESPDFNSLIAVCRDFLERFDALDAFDKLTDEEYRAYSKQVKPKTEAIFDNLSLSMGSLKTSLDEFYKILKSGLDAAEISITPRKVNAVNVADADGFRLKRYKALFWLNANEGVLPVHTQDNGIISDKDIDALKRAVEPKICEINARSRRALFNSIFCADNLHLFYLDNRDGKKAEKSGFIAALAKLLNITESTDSGLAVKRDFSKFKPTESAARYPSAAAAKVRACERYYECAKTGAAVDSGTAAVLNLNGFSDSVQFVDTLDGGVAGSLFFGSETTSVSQLETYFNCPYAHFLKYGLRLKPRKEGGLKAFDFGNALHEAAEYFAARIDGVTDENLERTVEETVEAIFEKYDIFKQQTVKNEAAKNLILEESRAVCKALFEAYKQSGFSILGVEKKFGIDGDFKPLILDTSKGKVALSGKIDRIDTLDGNALIIDYKTGYVSAEIADVYFGKKIQPFIYLKALENSGFKPAGALYLPVNNDYSKDGAEDRFNYIGWLVNDVNLCAALDKKLGFDNPKSRFYPMTLLSGNKVKESGELALKNTKSILSEEQLTGILEYAAELSCRAVEEMFEGFIGKNPFTDSDSLPCDYCEAANICLLNSFKNVRVWKNAINKSIFSGKDCQDDNEVLE